MKEQKGTPAGYKIKTSISISHKTAELVEMLREYYGLGSATAVFEMAVAELARKEAGTSQVANVDESLAGLA